MARGLAAAVVCALLTFAGHVTAGGAIPDVGLLLVLALPLAGFLVALADRRRGPLAILALVGGSQLALHGLLQLLGTGHAATSGHTTMAGHAAMAGHTAVSHHTATSSDASMGGHTMAAGRAAMDGHPTPADAVTALLGGHPPAMLGAHALAVLVTAAVLAGAEEAVFTVAAALARALPSVPAPPRVAEPPRHIAAVSGPLDTRLRRVLARRVRLRRGPPPRMTGWAVVH